MKKFIKILQDIGELIVFKHSVFALPFIFTAMVVASKQTNDSVWFGFGLLVLGILCAVSARNFAMAYNRYKDEDIDKLNPRTANRPSVDGRVGRRNLELFIIANAAVFIITAYFINSLAFWLSFPILGILAGYSLFKRFSELAHLVLGLCLGLAPIAGAVAVSGEIPLWSVLLCLGVVFWVAGFDLLYSLQDIEFDQKMGLFSIPSVYGEKATMFISAIFHVVATLLWLLFAWAAQLGFLAFFGIVVSGVILFMEHRIVRRDFSKIDRAFFTLNGYLGILFFVFVLLSAL
ncbi:4-hydroxybenzoate polyprenyltransferase [Campylobacter sp. RM9344]|uniref:4-hydroxybenzoate polyprenyltransferase n=1 Tax=Campylobacter californiensis TaxID=1032243 RepID=A0AAW3ZSC8_9BACT|nr:MULTISPECIES: menaquinone biosynthesis prenyltransferase MqnP [unclassified Campylobacter]MBE2984583.1 4-hydroxybenzoate polyprenyltransferase [Campylobacter sp. RM6883]MBE2987050.1 4-hydroxybenzoate polyprenyltransferase [Campylobacter sp. RM12919]MBE2988663.1 4-hydroxybenzoate polyprenyltransferase [Campylobacter sp. RM12920]MBE2995129.1 4-hydroxybenzoate polyprenyltransferase [Campylobacter sp. RM6913]MBE3029050.1 4-hydroxybenzoate polyprenyltransferase [Campylobacter sp. RM9344]